MKFRLAGTLVGAAKNDQGSRLSNMVFKSVRKYKKGRSRSNR